MKKYQAVLFDLDGTLLPMDLDRFTKMYFGAIAKWLIPYGFEPDAVNDAIKRGSVAMVMNDGSRSNEATFWSYFEGQLGKADLQVFEQFYLTKAEKLSALCGFDPRAARVVSAVKQAGGAAILATNPMFPAIFTNARARWAGLDVKDFSLVTTYENFNYCKPNPDYYREILEREGLEASSCLMVGNDVEEDMVPAASVGMDVFLLTDCLINKKKRDISVYPHGDFDDLLSFLSQ